MNRFLQDNIKASLEYPESPFYLFPENIWHFQTNRPIPGKTTLNVPVNANLHENYNQDQTLFPIDVYYLTYSEHETFYVLWIPLIEKFVQVKRSDDANLQKNIIRDEIKKTVYAHTKGKWQDVLVESSCITSFEVQHFTFTVDDPTLTQHYTEQLRKEEFNNELKPSDVGLTEVVKCSAHQLSGFENQVERMTESLSLDRPISVLIVGEPGVGKTSLWKQFAQRAIQNHSNFSCYSTTPIIMGANDYEDMDYQPDTRLEQIAQFAKKHRGAYYLGNLWELNQVGQYYRHPISVADYLVPYLEKKSFGVVAECNNEQFADLEQAKPGLIQLFDVIKLEPTNTEATNNILHKSAEGYKNIQISDEAISTITGLYKKYSAYESLPGAAVKFLDLLLSKNANIGKKEINKSDVIDFFTLQTGLPNFLLDPAIPFDHAEAKQFFTSRVIGQDGTSDSGDPNSQDVNAVDTVVALLETVKSGLARQTGPIATLLFIGPTGVGKTEMAKALAEYLYSDPSRMIRLDMSEYSDPDSADRLINGLNGGEGILTSQVRAQPFGVVLLDEFEKADPSVFDMFLQVMGEGRLTDSSGRLAVFTNCVIILTSNLGVDTYEKTSMAMQQSQQDTTQEHFTEAVAKLVRPELLNRIDRIVPFRALSKPVLREILNLEFKSVNRRLGVRWRQLNISYDDAVIDKLVELGYTPKFGARPLRRTVETYILHPLAEALAKRNSKTPYDVRFSLSQKKNKAAENSVKPEQLFNISIKSRAQDSNSKTPALSAQQIAFFLQQYRSFAMMVNSVYHCDYVESLQSQVLYEEQCLSERSANNPYFKRSNKQQIILTHNIHKDVISRLYQMRQKAFSLENDMIYDYLTSKERFSNRVLGNSPDSADFLVAKDEFRQAFEDLFFCLFPINKGVAYFSSEDTSCNVFFELLLSGIVPSDLISGICLYTNHIESIQTYLDRYTTKDSVYRWVDNDGNINTEKSKKDLLARMKPDRKRLVNTEKDKDDVSALGKSLAENFKYFIIECDPSQFGSIYKTNEFAVNSSMMSIETADRHSMLLLSALGGVHVMEGMDYYKDGELTKKDLRFHIGFYSHEQCQFRIQSSERSDYSWMSHHYQFSSSKPLKEYSSDKGFYFSNGVDKSNRIMFDIDSLKKYFDDYIVKFLYWNFVTQRIG
ncbi:MAG: ATP-dependent Clp protease ATP-binding subunit [Thermoguttaceae bacterium]|nr:ATP-dependent Clp protease ATP-binding subunit [Thermoguttaceae bacterium]